MAAAELLLLRHGIAEARQPGRQDAGRALTERGLLRSRQVLERLVAGGLTAQRLVSSPLTRARQTAELAVRAGLAPALEFSEALAPGGQPRWLLARWLDGLTPVGPERPRLLLVGHEPDLGDLAAALLGAPPGSITLRKAGLASLRLAEHDPAAAGASLRLLLTPRLLLGSRSGSP